MESGVALLLTNTHPGSVSASPMQHFECMLPTDIFEHFTDYFNFCATRDYKQSWFQNWWRRNSQARLPQFFLSGYYSLPMEHDFCSTLLRTRCYLVANAMSKSMNRRSKLRPTVMQLTTDLISWRVLSYRISPVYDQAQKSLMQFGIHLLVGGTLLSMNIMWQRRV